MRNARTHPLLILAPLLWLGVAGCTSGTLLGWNAYDQGNYEDAHESALALAEQGDASSQFLMGVLYAGGKGVPQDLTKAASWYRRAADQGYGPAQANLGTMHLDGAGVERDLDEARRLLQLAADQGLAQAQFSLGSVYHRGLGVAPDPEAAARWLRLAADQALPRRRPIWACSISAAGASRRMTPKPPAGCAAPPSRGSPLRRPTSA